MRRLKHTKIRNTGLLYEFLLRQITLDVLNSDKTSEAVQIIKKRFNENTELGKELALKNIAVNCVTPAAAKTRIFEQITQQHIDYMLSKIPRNRFVKVEELASLVAWLSSEENSFTTAGVFDLSGGRATY